jgi:hypothetical protein
MILSRFPQASVEKTIIFMMGEDWIAVMSAHHQMLWLIRQKQSGSSWHDNLLVVCV